MRNSAAPARVWWLPARKSRPAQFRARSAPSRRSIRAWKRMWRRPWASYPSRFRPRLSRATATRLFRDAWRDRRLGGAAGHGDPPSATHRSAGGGGILLGGTEGFLGDAAQAQSGAVGESDRPRPHGARLRDAGDGKCRAVARTGYFAFVGRTHDRAR